MVSYLLLVVGFAVPTQIGPFDNAFACEQAANQVRVVSPKHIRTACINLKAKPHHWNGKPLK